MSTPTIYIYHHNDYSNPNKVVVCSISEEEAKEIAQDILGEECYLACSINPMQLGYEIYGDSLN